MSDALGEYLDHAEAAARAGGAMLRDRPTRIEHKGAIDLVTERDLASEQRIREVFAAATPGIPVQGEETGGAREGTRWVVDPLDGTTNFVHGYAPWCVSVALVEGTRPLVGVVYDPERDRCFRAAVGGGAWLDGARLRVSDTGELVRALAVTGFPSGDRTGAWRYLALVQRVLEQTQGVRRSGSAAMDLATLATGASDFFWEFGLKPWDTSAGVLLVTEAGGRVTDLEGDPHTPDSPSILASNARLHDVLLRLLAA